MIIFFIILFIFLALSNILVGLLNKNNFLLFLLLFIIIWTMYWSNSSHVDYNNYLRIFSIASNNNNIFDFSNLIEGEIGFYISIKLASLSGLTLNGYIFLASLISYIIIFYSLHKLKINYNLAIGAYIVVPYFLDVVQLRNFIGLSFLLLGFLNLFHKSFGSSFRYIFFVLIASTFHYSYILFLPFLIYKSLNSKIKFNIYIFLSLMLTLITLINNKQIPFLLNLVSFFTTNPRVLNWLIPQTNLGFLLYWTVPFTFILTSWFFYKFNINGNRQLSKRIYEFNLVSIFTLPFYFYSSTFNRLSRNIYLMQFGLFSVKNHGIYTNIRRIFASLSLLIFLGHGFYIYLFYYYESVILNILNDNFFSNFLLNLF